MERFTVSASTNGSFPHRRQTTFNASIISLPYKPRPLPPHPGAGVGILLRPENPTPLPAIDAPGLGVFRAERYFSVDEDGCYPCGSSRCAAVSDRCDFSPYPLETSATSLDRSYGRQESSRTLPTPSSEASSWNSRCELLPYSSDPASDKKAASSPPRKPPSATAARKWWLWLCCLYVGKASTAIIVEERCKEPKTAAHSNYDLGSPVGSARDSKFSSRKHRTGGRSCAFPAIPEATMTMKETRPAKVQVVGKWMANEVEKESYAGHALHSTKTHYLEGLGSRIVSSTAGPGVGAGFSFPILTKPTQEDPHRDSLEVFCPKGDATPMAEAEFRRRSFTFQTSAPSAPRLEDDLASDSSSDLFEIESFSTVTGAPCHRRDSLDAALGMMVEARRLSAQDANEVLEDEMRRASSVTASDWCYPPSEVSVQWSVTTADGFDQASEATYSRATSVSGDPWFALMAEQERAVCEDGGRCNGSDERRMRLSAGQLGCHPKMAVGMERQPTRHAPEPRPERNAARAPSDAARVRNSAGGGGGIGGNVHESVSKPLKEPQISRRNPWIARPIETW